MSAHRATGPAIGEEKENLIDVGTLAAKGLELIDSPSPLLTRFVGDGPSYMARSYRSLEERALFFVRLFAEHQYNPTVASAATAVLQTCRVKWEDGRGLSREGVNLIKGARELQAFVNDGTIDILEHALFGLCSARLEQTSDFAALVEIAHMNSSLIASPMRSLESWRSEFREFVNSEMTWLLDDVDDPDLIEQEFDAIHSVAEELGEDVSEYSNAVVCRVAYLRDHQDYEPDEDDWPRAYSAPAHESTAGEVDALFTSLQ
jgi:hypothetical protein